MSVASFVINEKRQIKHQLQISYLIVLFASTLICLGICLALIFTLNQTTHETAENKITTQTTETLESVALEVGGAVTQQLKLISENVVLSSVLFASILIKHSNLESVNGTLFRPIEVYRDYNFVPGCQPPSCPIDYPPLEFSSPLVLAVPNSFINGSYSHPSVYLYSKKYNEAACNDSFWDLVVEESPEINNVVNGLVYQDHDFAINYKPENNAAVATLFYLTAQIENLQTGITNIVHRTFPGVPVDEVRFGDPTNRNWFTYAPVNGIYFDGPYIQRLTGKEILAISSRKVVYFPEGTQEQRITFVSSGFMTLERLGYAIDLNFTDSGFAAVINTQTNELLAWKNQYISVYDAATKTFYTMEHFDPKIAAKIHPLSIAEKQNAHTIRYTDNDGIEWLVAYQPMFSSQRQNEDTSYSPLAILVWSKLDESNVALVVLTDQINDDTQDVWVTDVIILLATIVVVMLLVYFLVQYITFPLPKLMGLAEEMILMSTASEEDKDFSVILSDPLFSLDRHDEIGLLIADYYQLLTVLHERSLMNRDMSQYPENPFYITSDDEKSAPTHRSTNAPSSDRVSSNAPPAATIATTTTTAQQQEYNWQWFTNQMTKRLTKDQRVSFRDCTKPKAPLKTVSFDEQNTTHTAISRIKPKKKSSRLGYKIVPVNSNFEGNFETIPEDMASVQSEPSSQLSNNAKDNAEQSQQSQLGTLEVVHETPQQSELIARNNDTENQLTVQNNTSNDNKYADESGNQNQSAEIENNIADLFVADRSSRVSVRSKQSANEAVTVKNSLRTQLASLFALLLLGCALAMTLTAYNIQYMGKQWAHMSKHELRIKADQNMQSILGCKAAFALVYFMQLSADIYCLAQFYRDLARGAILRPNWYSSNNPELYLQSYALDPTDTYATGVIGSKNYSAYDVSYAAGCELTADNCSSAHNSYNTRMTSLMDLKLKSMYRPGNDVSYIQTGLENDGTVRFISYRHTVFHRPPVCYQNDFTEPHCFPLWNESSCNPSWINPINANQKFYSTYDIRCRDWYQNAARNNTIQYSTIVTVTQHEYVLLGNYAVYEVPETKNNFLGVIRAAFSVSGLSDGLSSLNYMHDGYCYMVRGDDTTAITFHPKAEAGCTTVLCVEGFSADEYTAFRTAVLIPLQNYQDILIPGSIDTTFIKGGKEWQLVYARTQYTNLNFILIAVLPVDVINETADEITRKINNSLISFIIAFVISLVLLISLITWYASVMVSSIVDPINELRKVFELVRMNEDLSGQVPEEASSSDMRVLLTAFSKLMIALRFSNESYAQGNQKRAFNVYTDALSLYTTNNDKRGIGMSLANLAASELARQKYDAAESLYKKSISNAEDILFDTVNPLSRAEEIKIERLLSDRKEGLAEVYFQSDRLADAMAVLNPAMESDIQIAYLNGYAQKQCAIARYHQLKGKLTSAEKILDNLLKYVRNSRQLRRQPTAPMSPNVAGSQALTTILRVISTEERESAEQIALYRIAVLKKEMSADVTVIESALLYALTKNSTMHADTTGHILIMLKKVFTAEEDRRSHVLQLNWLAQEFNLNVDRDKSIGGFAQTVLNELKPPKRVMFCVDYSSAISSALFASVMDNINTIFELHINPQDSISILHYGTKISFALPPTVKRGNELLILDSMEMLTEPSGKQMSLYDAAMVSLYTLSREPTSDDWLIVVTSGEDTMSRVSLSKTMERVMLDLVGLIVIGIGEGVHSAALQLLVSSTKRGVYFHANADTKSINEAFDHATKIMEMSGSGGVVI